MVQHPGRGRYLKAEVSNLDKLAASMRRSITPVDQPHAPAGTRHNGINTVTSPKRAIIPCHARPQEVSPQTSLAVTNRGDVCHTVVAVRRAPPAVTQGVLCSWSMQSAKTASYFIEVR